MKAIATIGHYAGLVAKNAALVPARGGVPAHVPIESLPPVVARVIQRQVGRVHHEALVATGQPATFDKSGVPVPNPFMVHSHKTEVASLRHRHDLPDESKTRKTWVPKAIPVRRQKILLQSYPSITLPPSDANPIKPSEVPLVKFGPGANDFARWVGVWRPKPAKPLYNAKTRKARKGEMFLGTEAERERPNLEKLRAERLKSMPKRIEAWKQTKAEEAAGKRSSLPF